METKARNCLTWKEKTLILANHEESQLCSEIVYA